jgi:hypothetical protein
MTRSPSALHPGPLGYYLLAPVYRLFGGSAWALQVSTAAVHALGIWTAVAVAWRDGGRKAVAFATLFVLIVEQGLGFVLLTEPWHPYLPVSWFAAFLVTCWSVSGRRWSRLPILVATASVCARMHIAYVPVCGGIVALVVVIAATRVSRAEERYPFRSVAATLLVGGVLWLPTIFQEISGNGGNYSRLIAPFLNGTERALAFADSARAVGARLDLRAIVIEPLMSSGVFARPAYIPPSVPVAGGVTVGLWLVAAFGTRRHRNAPLGDLHRLVFISLTVSLMVGTGDLHHALPWAFVVGALVWTAIVASVASMLARSSGSGERGLRVAATSGLAAVGLVALRASFSAANVEPSHLGPARDLRELSSRVIERIDAGTGAATGTSGRYLVPPRGGGRAWTLSLGLVNELERAGFDAAFDLPRGNGGFDTEPSFWATARVVVAAFGAERYRSQPGAVEIAGLGAYPERDRARRARLLAESLVTDLAPNKCVYSPFLYLGGHYVVPPRNALPRHVAERLEELSAFGDAVSVFILP